MFKTILKKAMPLPKLTQFDNYLFVGPHPDDIEVACGSTVAKLVSLGKRITFAIVTDGCVGGLDETLTEKQLIKLRQQEALASANFLGVSDVRFLGYTDGGDYDLGKVKADLVKIIIETNAQVVFAPDFATASECHPDHINTGRITAESAFCASWDKITARMGISGSVKQPTLALYYTDKPNGYLCVKGMLDKHLQAVSLHKSQFAENDLKVLKTYFSLRQIRFGLRKCCGRADGYRVLGAQHQHCFPEVCEF